MKEIQFTDRYEATGIPYPDPETMCRRCEGMGFYPVMGLGMHSNYDASFMTDDDFEDQEIWYEYHNRGNFIKRFIHKMRCDGWHFIKCPDCKGTRLKESK